MARPSREGYLSLHSNMMILNILLHKIYLIFQAILANEKLPPLEATTGSGQNSSSTNGTSGSTSTNATSASNTGGAR